MEEEDEKELQLLPSTHSIVSSSQMASDSSTSRIRSTVPSEGMTPSSVDLQLSISVRPAQSLTAPICESVKQQETACVEALKWQAAEQIRLAAMEKAYAERMKELTKREMELAQSEFAHAKQMWERAKEEVERAERMKEMATTHVDSTCMEVTCQSCRKRFKP